MARGGVGRRPDESMTLLVEIMERPLDPAYAAAAAARGDRPRRRRPWNTVVTGVAALVIGALFATSTLTLARGWSGREGNRAELVARIDERRRAVDERSAQIVGTRSQLRALETGALDAAGQERAEIDRLRLAAGDVAVEGPGLRITLDDAAGLAPALGDGPRAGGDEETGRIVYRDLQNLTNDLWASGAEAISINGHRLTSTSAIRFAGRAILVGFRPLARPYVIDAVVGDRERAAFLAGSGGAYLADLRTAFEVRAEAAVQSALTIPPAESVSLRYARVPTGTARAPGAGIGTATGIPDTKDDDG